MPQKTKKQKIVADTRHKFHFTSQGISYQLPQNMVMNNNKTNSTMVFNHAYFREDLIKTIFLGILFIALEIGLYFWLKR